MWGPSSPCGVVVGLGFTVNKYKALSRQGLREDVGCRFVKVDGRCYALGLEPAFRQGFGLGVGFCVQVKVKKDRSTRYIMGFMACV